MKPSIDALKNLTPSQLQSLLVSIESIGYRKTAVRASKEFSRPIRKADLQRYKLRAAPADFLQDSPENDEVIRQILKFAADGRADFTASTVHVLEQLAFQLALTCRSMDEDLNALVKISTMLSRFRNTALRERMAAVQEGKLKLREQQLGMGSAGVSPAAADVPSAANNHPRNPTAPVPPKNKKTKHPTLDHAGSPPSSAKTALDSSPGSLTPVNNVTNHPNWGRIGASPVPAGAPPAENPAHQHRYHPQHAPNRHELRHPVNHFTGAAEAVFHCIHHSKPTGLAPPPQNARGMRDEPYKLNCHFKLGQNPTFLYSHPPVSRLISCYCMKNRSKWLYPLLLCTAVAASRGLQAQDVTLETFDSEDAVTRWTRWWGAATQTYEFDPSVDANNNAASGSLKATIGFDKAANGGDNQFAVIGAFADGATIDGTQYTNLVFDLKWDPASVQRSFGDYGSLEFGFRKADFSQLWLTPASPITLSPAIVSNGWLHVVAPIDPAAAGLDAITGVALKMWRSQLGSNRHRHVLA